MISHTSGEVAARNSHSRSGSFYAIISH